MHQLFKTNFKCLEFDGEFLSLLGSPEITGSWLIWGKSGNGKTRFALQLAKYFALLGIKVAYDSLEEGKSKSMKAACIASNMHEVSRRFILLDKEPIEELSDRLSRPRSPQVIIIDSLQYTGLNYAQYKKFRDTFRSKLFIFISHADGKEPAGRAARSIRSDAFVKIWIEGYKAFALSRYGGGGEPYTIWEEGAERYIHVEKF